MNPTTLGKLCYEWCLRMQLLQRRIKEADQDGEYQSLKWQEFQMMNELSALPLITTESMEPVN